jgi:hypothetical protein
MRLRFLSSVVAAVAAVQTQAVWVVVVPEDSEQARLL